MIWDQEKTSTVIAGGAEGQNGRLLPKLCRGPELELHLLHPYHQGFPSQYSKDSALLS